MLMAMIQGVLLVLQFWRLQGNGNVKHDVLEHYPDAGDCTCAVDVPHPDVRDKAYRYIT